MRARKVNEHTEFKRSGDITKSLGVGVYKPFKDGDKIRLLKPIYIMAVDNGIGSGSGLWSSPKLFLTKSEALHVSSPIYSTYEIDTILQWDGLDGEFWNEDKMNCAIPLKWMLEHSDHYERISDVNEFKRETDITKTLGVGKYNFPPNKEYMANLRAEIYRIADNYDIAEMYTIKTSDDYFSHSNPESNNVDILRFKYKFTRSYDEFQQFKIDVDDVVEDAELPKADWNGYSDYDYEEDFDYIDIKYQWRK